MAYEKMNLLNIPNIPKKRVRLALVDGRISSALEEGLAQRGIEIVKTEAYPWLYPAISCHPDAVFHHLGGNLMVYAPGTSAATVATLENMGFLMIEGEKHLTAKYPGSVHYNVARVGNLAFHNTRYTDRILRENLYNCGVELVHVNQGYTKCAVSVVDENSIITMDRGIAKVAEKKGLDVLVIDEDGILLPGIQNGFIGGATCLIDDKKFAVAGNIYRLKSAMKIIDFLSQKGIEHVSLSEEPVTDIGTIIPLLTV